MKEGIEIIEETTEKALDKRRLKMDLWNALNTKDADTLKSVKNRLIAENPPDAELISALFGFKGRIVRLNQSSPLSIS